MKKLISLMLAFLLMISTAYAAQIDWNYRYTYAELEAQMRTICEEYPDLTQMYQIGHTWRERSLWCVEITDETVAKEEKTGIAVFGNIHGGERESASCAMYFMWWLTANSKTEKVQDLLKDYVVYVIPVINPDGYEQSFVINTRENMRPLDLNGDGIPFSDPYTDLDGDGAIGYLLPGKADDDMTWLTEGPWYITYLPEFQQKTLGLESPDWDGNGILGDDPRNSGVDMNRTFDYQWGRYDIDAEGTELGTIGDPSSFPSAGGLAALDPEIQAVQNFLIKTDVNALVTLHTGIQCVLYPWCYRQFDPSIDGEDILFMKDTAAKMAAAYQNTTGRGFYTKSSWEDYPTAAELIDWSYGRLNIHSYTIEVYCPGKSATGDIAECCWEDDLPEATLKFYTLNEVAAMGLDLSSFDLGNAEGVWFYTPSDNLDTNYAPADQDIMCEGCKDALLVMMESEPYGQGWTVPWYLQ